MNPVEYSLSLQRILALLGGLSFFTLCLVLGFTNPEEEYFYYWFILFLLWLIGLVILALILYWWCFSIKKEIISIRQANLTIVHGGFISITLVFSLVLWQTSLLQFPMILFLLVLNIIYSLWIRQYR